MEVRHVVANRPAPPRLAGPGLIVSSTVVLTILVIVVNVGVYIAGSLIWAMLAQERRLARFRAEVHQICERAANKLRQMEALQLPPERFRVRERIVEEWLHERLAESWDEYIRIFRYPRIRC